MAFPEWLSERLFYSNRRDYTARKGDVAYLDSSPLERPMRMPAAQRIVAAVIAVIAIAIGAYFVNSTILESMREAASMQESIENNLKRPSSLESLPIMKDIVALDDEGILAAFEEAGYKTFDASSTTESPDLVLYRVPDDMTLEETAALYSQGVSNLSAVQASKLLNGSWYFTSDRENWTMVVRYADFTTNDPVVAVQNALAHEGFDPESVNDSGIDESGNTYTAGTIVVEDYEYKWKISALPLDDIYSITNLPDEACYVGVRMSA